MYYTIDAVTSSGNRSIDVFPNSVEYWEAFAAWEGIVTDGHDGVEIDLGRAGYLGLMTGDRVRLVEWSDDPDCGGVGTVVQIETISADATKRRVS